jgi:glucose/arabinose dehydrogenase
LADHAGSIIRIRTDGGVPHDNPFVSHPGARPEIWTLGHRNPLGLAWDRGTGKLWSHENGPQGGDELNLIEAGRNYGWPVISYGIEYTKPPPSERSGPTTIEGTAKEGMEQPIHHWTPAMAPSGLAITHEDGATMLWLGALRGQSLVRLTVEADRVIGEARMLREEIGRIRDVALGPDGQHYVLADGGAGLLYRLDEVVAQARGGGSGRNRRL